MYNTIRMLCKQFLSTKLRSWLIYESNKRKLISSSLPQFIPQLLLPNSLYWISACQRYFLLENVYMNMDMKWVISPKAIIQVQKPSQNKKVQWCSFTWQTAQGHRSVSHGVDMAKKQRKWQARCLDSAKQQMNKWKSYCSQTVQEDTKYSSYFRTNVQIDYANVHSFLQLFCYKKQNKKKWATNSSGCKDEAGT